jgi:hypothetical protein
MRQPPRSFHAHLASCALATVLVLTGAAACRPAPGKSANVPDVPVYPGAVLRMADVRPDLDPTEYYTVTGATSAEVGAWYREQMPRRGWNPTSDPESDFVSFQTVEGCYAFVGTFALPDGGVDLQISQQRAGTPCYPYATAAASPGDD